MIPHARGSGAIKGLVEASSPDLHAGGGNLAAPIDAPSRRGWFEPDVRMVSRTGQGNGTFGLAGTLNVPAVSGETRKRAPVYGDEQDVLSLAGMEQLVPVASPAPGATRYSLRTEGLFARITRVTSNIRNPRPEGPIVRSSDATKRLFGCHLSETVAVLRNRIEYLYEWEPTLEDGSHRWDRIYWEAIHYIAHGCVDDLQFLIAVKFASEPHEDSLRQLDRFEPLVRAETVVFTDEFIDTPRRSAENQLASAVSQPQGVTAWHPEYPDEFRNVLPALGGYRQHCGQSDAPGSPGGYPSPSNALAVVGVAALTLTAGVIAEWSGRSPGAAGMRCGFMPRHAYEWRTHGT